MKQYLNLNQLNKILTTNNMDELAIRPMKDSFAMDKIDPKTGDFILTRYINKAEFMKANPYLSTHFLDQMNDEVETISSGAFEFNYN